VQKFTRPLTREIELGGERLALTFSEKGVAIRPVGSRRPPHEVSWSALLALATGHAPAVGSSPTAEGVTASLAALKGGAPAPKATVPPVETPAETPAEAPPAPLPEQPVLSGP
jgi:hypothetical protein